MYTRELLSFTPLIAGLICAATIDMRSRRIPNWLTLPMLAAGLAGAALGHLPVSAGQAWAGAGLGFGLAFVMFVLGAMGGGDVKLMAAIGAWVGGPKVLLIFAAAAVVGMVIVICQQMARGKLGELFHRSAALAVRAAATRDLSVPEGLGLSDEPSSVDALGRKPLPFAVSGLLGTLIILGLGAWR